MTPLAWLVKFQHLDNLEEIDAGEVLESVRVKAEATATGLKLLDEIGEKSKYYTKTASS